jgi:hypothetical protein
MLGFGTATAAVVVVSEAPLLVLSSCFNKAFWCSTVVAGVVVTAAAEALFSSSLVTSGAALEGEVNTWVVLPVAATVVVDADAVDVRTWLSMDVVTVVGPLLLVVVPAAAVLTCVTGTKVLGKDIRGGWTWSTLVGTIWPEVVIAVEADAAAWAPVDDCPTTEVVQFMFEDTIAGTVVRGVLNPTLEETATAAEMPTGAFTSSAENTALTLGLTSTLVLVVLVALVIEIPTFSLALNPPMFACCALDGGICVTSFCGGRVTVVNLAAATTVWTTPPPLPLAEEWLLVDDGMDPPAVTLVAVGGPPTAMMEMGLVETTTLDTCLLTGSDFVLTIATTVAPPAVVELGVTDVDDPTCRTVCWARPDWDPPTELFNFSGWLLLAVVLATLALELWVKMGDPPFRPMHFGQPLGPFLK